MGTSEKQIAEAIAGALKHARVDLQAELAWQREPNVVADYLRHHIHEYDPEQRRFLYAKALELKAEVRIPLIVSCLQNEDDAASVMLMEKMLTRGMTADDLLRYLPQHIQCQNPIAEKAISRVRAHFQRPQ